jgi:transposase
MSSLTARLSLRQRRSGFKGSVVKLVERSKVGGRSGRPVRESLRIDRSDPTKTVKTHHVEEQRPDGTWEVVHDERIESPAKTPRGPAGGDPPRA